MLKQANYIDKIEMTTKTTYNRKTSAYRGSFAAAFIQIPFMLIDVLHLTIKTIIINQKTKNDLYGVKLEVEVEV
jgi:signal transduction histidine kinase